MTDQMSLAVFDPIKATVADLVKKDKAQVFDPTTPEGEKELRSWVHRVRGYKGDIERIRVTTKADALAFGRKVDELAKELTKTPELIIKERMKPLDEIEAKKRADAEAIVEAERLAEEKVEEERLAELKRREAEVAKKEAEIQEKERIEREKLIADVAAGNARKEAEAKAEAEKQAILDAAARKQREAEEKVRQAIRLAAEKEAAEESAKERLAEAEQKRIADVKHRKSIEDDIYTALLHFVDVGPCASAIVTHMKNGEIPHITINY